MHPPHHFPQQFTENVRKKLKDRLSNWLQREKEQRKENPPQQCHLGGILNKLELAQQAGSFHCSVMVRSLSQLSALESRDKVCNKLVLITTV